MPYSAGLTNLGRQKLFPEMRQARIKIDAEKGEAVYHCISKTVNGEWLFDNAAKEIFRRQLWLVAEFCGLQVITYTMLSNHFHVLVRVPVRTSIADAELLRRYRLLYPKPTKYRSAQLAVICSQLETNGPEAVTWRRRLSALMGDVSSFMKLLKQRFTVWFNNSHSRFGTLWAERFKSSLIEPMGRVVETIAAYLELNAVRAGLAADPKDYRFCGYADAVSGHAGARDGLGSMNPGLPWDQVQSGYRQVLFGTGAGPREHGRSIRLEDYQRVMAEKGTLTMAEVLRCRIRHFADGAVLGTTSFVLSQLEAYRQRTGRRKRTAPRPLPPITDWGDLVTLRGLRRRQRC